MARPEREGGGDGPGPGRVRRLLVLCGQLALTAAVTWFIVDRLGLSLAELGDFDPARWTPSWGLLALSSAVLFAGYVISGVVWGVMVRDLGGPVLPAAVAVRIYLVANLGRYIPGKLWQIAGLALLARRAGVRPSVATAAAVLGQLVALAAATVVGATALLGAGPGYRRAGVWTLAALAVITAVALVPPVFRRLLTFWPKLARLDAPEVEDVPLAEVGPARVLFWGFLYLVNWSLYAISFWILVRSFDLPGSVLQVAPAFAAAYVVGYAAVFAPAGIGIREGALTALLGPITGVAPAATVALIARIWATVVEVVPAGALWVGSVTRTASGDVTGTRSRPGSDSR